MRRLLPILLTAFLLLTQWGLVTHAYEAHDDEQVCELCLAKQQHDQVLLASPPTLSFASSFGLSPRTDYSLVPISAFQHYSVRAPPLSL